MTFKMPVSSGMHCGFRQGLVVFAEQDPVRSPVGTSEVQVSSASEIEAIDCSDERSRLPCNGKWGFTAYGAGLSSAPGPVRGLKGR